MKIACVSPTFGVRRHRRRQDASAVIVVIFLLAIVFVYIGGNLRTLHHLGRELRLVERQQVRRLKAMSAKIQADGQKPGPQVATVVTVWPGS